MANIQRIEIPLVGGQYIGRSTDVDAQECINLYPVLDRSGGRVLSLQPVPGLVTHADPSLAGTREVRGFIKFNEIVAYVVISNIVYKMDTLGNLTALAITIFNDAGPVQMVSNGTQILLGDLTDNNGYVIESDVVSQPADLVGVRISSVSYQDGLAMVSIAGTQKWRISTLDTASIAAYSASDFTRWNVLDFTSAEGLPDILKAIRSDHQEVWEFGADSLSFKYNSGDPDFPFTTTQHPYQEIGLGGEPTCIDSLDNSLFWLDSWHNVRRAQGYTPIIVSTPELSYNLEQVDISVARSFAYRYEGQAFYVLNVPGATYVYDVSTGMWCRRSSGLDGERWRANCYIDFGGKHLVGDFENGKIYELDHEVFTEDGETFPATRTTKYTDSQRRRVFYHRIELHLESGVGNSVSPGDDPQVMMQFSDDGGHTWSVEDWKPMGKIGQYRNRVIWRRKGRSRERIFRFKITDPVDRVLIALYADVSVARN